MKKCNTWCFRGVFGIIFMVIVASLLSGCMESNRSISADIGAGPDSPSSDTMKTPGNQNASPAGVVLLQDPSGIQSNQSLNITVHSAIKTNKIKDRVPMEGNIFVVINLTVENLAGKESYTANETTVKISGGGPITQKMYDKVSNPFYWGSISPQDKKSGEMVFGVKASTAEFTLTFIDEKGDALFTQSIGSVPAGHYNPSIEPGLLGNSNFSCVVDNLDTPEKAAQYADAKFAFVYHDGCKSYAPEEMFRRGTGDCKDFATFLSYVLSHHGYDTQIVVFKYYKGSNRNAHVVTLYKDGEGALNYMTTPYVSDIRRVTSVDDLLSKECARLGVSKVANYIIVPAGSQDTCIS